MRTPADNRASEQAAPALALRGASKSFRVDGRTVCAVQKLDLAIAPGECVSVVGESGAGKTTCARMAALLERPSVGRVYWDGRDVTNLSGRALRAVRAQVQYVAQDPATTFDPRWTIGESVAEALQNLRHCGKNEAAALAAELFDAVGLPQRTARALPRELSGGQLQRASIARALAPRPRTLVLDEVTSALDTTSQESILALLESVRAQTGAAMLFVCHDLAVAQRMGDRVMVMREGRAVAECAADELARSESPYVRELLSATLTID